MSLRDDLETVDPSEEVQKAYNQSIVSSDGGHPWTIARHSAALTLGCEIMSVVGPNIRQLIKKGSYANSLRDVIIILWISSLNTEEVIQLNIECDVKIAVSNAFSWAESEGVTYGSQKYIEGLTLITSIVSNILASFPGSESKPEVKKNPTNLRGKSG